MFKEMTYKKKNRLLIVVAILLVFISYNFAIKKTLVAKNDYSVAEEQIALASNAPMLAAQLEKELIQMNDKIGADSLKGKNPGQKLLELVTDYCQTNQAVLREFPEATVTEQEKLTVETNLFIVEGNFSTLINLVYLLEQKSKLGKVASVHYQLKKDLKSKQMVLVATTYLQNVKKKENEK